MSDGLYLGKQVDPATGAPGARLELDPADLLTHGLIVGMTGSGKTGLAIVLVEEVLRQGVPVIAIDPKGDLANLLLLFDELDPASVRAVDRRRGGAPRGPRREAGRGGGRGAWKKGLADWGLSADDVAALKKGHDAVVFTPGSSAGVPLNVLQSLDAPAVPLRQRRRGPARRDPVARGRAARPRARRRRPAAVAAGRLPRDARRARVARGQGPLARAADRRDRGPAVRQDRRAAARDRVPAQGPPGADDGAQQPAGLAVVREPGAAASRSTSRGCCARPTAGRACRSSRSRTCRTRSACSWSRCCSTR